MVEITKLDNGKTLVNGIELIYCSGSTIPFFKLKHRNKDIQEENFDDFAKMFSYMKSRLKGYFTMGTLYNAYQEKSDGEFLTTNNLGHEFILSDSGGLQQARFGQKFSDEVKREIYLNQAKHSHVAMTFDEIPFKTIAANFKTGVNLMATRCYIRDLIPITAKESAIEIQKQIEVFNEIETNTKILPVLHGFRSLPQYFRGYKDNTYIDYARVLLDNINNSNNHVGGLSFGSMTISADNRVGVLKSLYYITDTILSEEIDNDYLQHIHLLGLASPQRLMTFLSLVRTGILSKNIKRISFDSTALTKAYTVGRIHKNRYEFENDTPMKPELTLKDYKDPSAKNVRHYYKQVHSYFKNYKGYMFDSWEDLANHSKNNGSKKKAQDQIIENGGVGSEWHKKYMHQIRLCTMYATACYLEAMEDYIDGIRTVDDFPYGSDLSAIYYSIEHDIKDRKTLYEAVEMHYSKVKSEMDYGVDTIEQYEELLTTLTHEAKFGKQETNVLFDDVKKLHDAHEDQTNFAKIRIDNHNFMRRSKKKHTDEFKSAKEITKSLF